jgi:phenylacetate-CoA ligase
MQDLSSRPVTCSPIETASADELRSLQTERLRRSARRTYDNVPFTGPRSTTLGCTPTT